MGISLGWAVDTHPRADASFDPTPMRSLRSSPELALTPRRRARTDALPSPRLSLRAGHSVTARAGINFVAFDQRATDAEDSAMFPGERPESGSRRTGTDEGSTVRQAK
jgi:hypothetical protein